MRPAEDIPSDGALVVRVCLRARVAFEWPLDTDDPVLGNVAAGDMLDAIETTM